VPAGRRGSYSKLGTGKLAPTKAISIPSARQCDLAATNGLNYLLEGQGRLNWPNMVLSNACTASTEREKCDLPGSLILLTCGQVDCDVAGI